jgi:uncharacterized protein (TIGR00369 family)
VTGFATADAGRTIATHLGLTMHEVARPDDEHPGVDGVAPVVDHLRGTDGNVTAGVLLTLLDSVGGLSAGLAVLPGWVVSTNLMMSTARFDHTGPFAVSGRVLRAGRKAVVTAVQITDEGNGGALVADGVLTSAVLQPAGGPPTYPRPLRLVAPERPPGDPPSPAEFFGSEPVDERTVAMPLAEHLRNPWGILHGGATAALVEAAAEHVANRTADRAASTSGAAPRMRTADCVLHFLAPGRVGPVEARAVPVGARPDGLVVEVSVHDRGADDRRMAVAVVTLRPV